MAGRGGSRWRAIAVVGGCLWLATSMTVIGVALGQDVGTAANVAELVLVPLAVVSAVAVLRNLWRGSPQTALTTTIEEAKHGLARQVRQQWEEEAAARSLDHPPDSMPVKWQLTARGDVMDRPGHIATGTPVFAGSSAQIGDLADQFRALRRRRLVILGGPGTGKTTLAVQLLLELLHSRREDEPVPVLFSVASWDTQAFPRLHDWLAMRLGQDYPSVRAAELGADLPRKLAIHRHILPVLDGLDELPDGARVAVLSALKQSLRASNDQLILTSRTIEYTQAIQEVGVLASAAVIKPQLLTPAAAAGYLRACLPTEPGQAWEQVLTSLEASAHNGGPVAALARITSTPLGLWLVRAVYTTPRADPTPLLDPNRFPNTTALRTHLLDGLIPALTATRTPPRGGDPASPFLPRRTHDPERVRHWLGYLAHHLNHTPTNDGQTGLRDFAWWQLARHTVPPRSLGLTFGLAFGLAFGPILGFTLVRPVGELVSGPVGELASRLIVGLALGLGLGLGLGLSIWPKI